LIEKLSRTPSASASFNLIPETVQRTIKNASEQSDLGRALDAAVRTGDAEDVVLAPLIVIIGDKTGVTGVWEGLTGEDFMGTRPGSIDELTPAQRIVRPVVSVTSMVQQLRPPSRMTDIAIDFLKNLANWAVDSHAKDNLCGDECPTKQEDQEDRDD